MTYVRFDVKLHRFPLSVSSENILREVHGTLIAHLVERIENATSRSFHASELLRFLPNKIYVKGINAAILYEAVRSYLTLHNSFIEARLLWKVRSRLYDIVGGNVAVRSNVSLCKWHLSLTLLFH